MDINTTWDLEKIYKNQNEINEDINNLNTYLQDYESNLENFKKDINSKDTPITFKKILDSLEKSSLIISKLFAYANMKRDEDASVKTSQDLVLKVNTLYANFQKIFSSFEPFILELEKNHNKVFNLCKNNIKSRNDYINILDKISRKKEHILDKSQEKILTVLSDSINEFENSYYMLSFLDMKFKNLSNGQPLNHGNYQSYITKDNRNIRKEAFTIMHQKQKEFINTLAANYYASVKAKENLAKLKNYKNLLEMELFSDNINTSLYDTLIDTVKSYIPVLTDYINIKKEKLNLDDFSNYDLYAKIFPSKEKNYSYEDACNIIREALKVMGSNYNEILDKGLCQRWIDVYPRENKKGGAYSFGSYDTDPFILTNFTNDLNSIFTLIHELGHSIHSYYSRKNNPYFTSDYTIFVAEVASTTNELLLFNYLINHLTDSLEKKNLIVYNLEQFRTTVFRQTMFAEFEKIVHEKIGNQEPLTGESFSKIYYDLNKEYYPKLKLDDNIAYEWARIPHFYSDYYVYKYATGFMSASFLSKKILEKDKNKQKENIENYINFLKDGSNHYPLEQLKIAGVHIDKRETMEQALDLFKSSTEKLKSL